MVLIVQLMILVVIHQMHVMYQYQEDVILQYDHMVHVVVLVDIVLDQVLDGHV
jgi:hypothetical protein